MRDRSARSLFLQSKYNADNVIDLVSLVESCPIYKELSRKELR